MGKEGAGAARVRRRLPGASAPLRSGHALCQHHAGAVYPMACAVRLLDRSPAQAEGQIASARRDFTLLSRASHGALPPCRYASAMLNAPAPLDVPASIPPRLLKSVAALAELAASTHRDTAAGVLHGVLRELRAAQAPGT